MMHLLTRPVLLFMLINAFGYASIHAFYPNMSKFFQSRFLYSNVQAGFISSLPYLIASFAVPFLGSLTAYFGEEYFEIMMFGAISLVLVVHMSYLSMSDTTEPTDDFSWWPVLPLFPFGLGHALFTTMQAPTVPKLVKNEVHLPRVFTYVKITESLGITFFVFMAGYVRQTTGCFTGVSLMMLICAGISMTGSFWLMQETKAFGGHMFDMETYRETYQWLQQTFRKFVAGEITPDSKVSYEKSNEHLSSEESDSSPEKKRRSGKNDSV